MNLNTTKNGTELTIQLSGELNTVTAPELSAALDKDLAGMDGLVMDFAECDYVSSAGLRVLLTTFKKMKASGGDMKLVNVGENFLDVLQNTGLDTVFGV